jgi:UvrD/REP helicase N-terminal domain
LFSGVTMSGVIEDFTEAYRAELGRHAHAFYSNWEAVADAGGPSLLVIDGAGAGKTAMLAHWVAARILGGADPKRIMLATYSRQAAAEINRRVERIMARLPPEAAAAATPTWSGAFHAIGARLLREYAVRIGLDPQFTIHDREKKAAGMPLGKPRRPRRLSLREAERQAGRPVASVTDRPDGSRTYAFGDKADADGEVNDWDIEYGASSPSSVRQ